MIKLQEQIDSLQTSKKQLEADNVSLYSKMKFLQSYNGNNNHSSTVAHNSMIGGIGSAFQKKFTVSLSLSLSSCYIILTVLIRVHADHHLLKKDDIMMMMLKVNIVQYMRIK